MQDLPAKVLGSGGVSSYSSGLNQGLLENSLESGDLGTLPAQPLPSCGQWMDDLSNLCLSFLACQEEAEVDDNSWLCKSTMKPEPLRGLEGIPGLHSAPQDEAGLARKFETSPVAGAPCSTTLISRSAVVLEFTQTHVY